MALRSPVRTGGSDIPLVRPGHPPRMVLKPLPGRRLSTEPRSQTPVCERHFAKLCFATGASVDVKQSSVPVLKQSLGTRVFRISSKR